MAYTIKKVSFKKGQIYATEGTDICVIEEPSLNGTWHIQEEINERSIL